MPQIGHLQHVDESKTLVATHEESHFPRELRCRLVDKSQVKVELFGEGWPVFAGPELIFPARVNGATGYVRYEIVDEHHRSGEVFYVYRKYDAGRRKMERSGLVLPGRS